MMDDMQFAALDGLPVDLAFPAGIDPADWRNLPDEDGEDEDEDEDAPTPAYVVSVLGFDPNEFHADDQRG